MYIIVNTIYTYIIYNYTYIYACKHTYIYTYVIGYIYFVLYTYV